MKELKQALELFLRSSIAAVLAAALLSGCAAGVDDELNGFISEVKGRPGGRIQPLPQINPYVAFQYLALVMLNAPALILK